MLGFKAFCDLGARLEGMKIQFLTLPVGHLEIISSERSKHMDTSGSVGALTIRIGFCRVLITNYSLIYPKACS